MSTVRDELQNLVSVLHHQLQSAQTASTYAEDAEHAQDEELARYFLEVQEQARDLADRAKALLQSRLGAKTIGRRHADALADEASQQSFPASDAPAVY